MTRLLILFLTIATATLSAASGAAARQSNNATAWEPITAERLLNPRPGDWLSYRRTVDVHGYSPLSRINRTNVRNLRPVWTYPVQDDSRWVPTPIVANGVMYVSEGRGRIIALDVKTGEVRWIHRRTYPEDIRISQAYLRQRGVAVYGDKIYWGTADSYLVALDARTGEQVWQVRTGDYKKGVGHAHPPFIVDGKVLLGFLGGEREVRGSIVAYEASSGDYLWTTYTVPARGEPGAESWGRSEMPPLGGPPWGTMSYDPELGLVYVGTGQPTPWATTLRGDGDALYTNCILALDVKTGKIRWYFQMVPGDNWDMDSPYESTLVDLPIGGTTRKALIHTSKVGWGVVLDRATGQFLQSFKTAYDNIITSWTPAGRPVYNPAVVPAPSDVDSGKEFEICPHFHGSRNLNAPSYSPVTKLYYVGINNSCMDVVFASQKYELGQAYQGMNLVRAKMAPGYNYIGEFVAFDPVSGTRRWTHRTESGAAMTASALATGGGIVFGGTADRYLFALDTESGKQLWRTRLNGDISGAPITFEVDGRQYVAVGAGGRIAQTTSFARLTNTDIPLGSGMIWVFALPE
jgi:alcohol dehydrogenase (cytochrome c)